MLRQGRATWKAFPDITVYEAVRLIVAMLPGGEPFPLTLTDEWIRGGYSMEEPQGSKLVAIYREAVDLLKRAVRSPDVRITGVSASRRADGRREIRDEERGLRLEIRAALLAALFGRRRDHRPRVPRPAHMRGRT